jgi:hypothetical protein
MSNFDDGRESERLLAERLMTWNADDVRQWLLERLDSRDTVLRQDRKADEDPDTVLIGFLQRRGITDPAAVKLGTGFRDLLRDLEQSRPTVESYHVATLRVCQQVYIPRTTAWFQKQLALITSSSKATYGEFDEMILRGAVVQVSGSQNPRARELWLMLLVRQSTSTIALHGLARTWLQQVQYLESWWNSETAAVRERELRHLLGAACREMTPVDVVSRCRENTVAWPQSLKDAIDRSLSLLGYTRPFRSQTCAIRNAIDGAARRRELVLEDTA